MPNSSMGLIRFAFSASVVLLGVLNHATGAQLLTKSPATNSVSSTASGDSVIQGLSPDGRFVLFASTANNLAVSNSSSQISALTPHWNIYWHDRQSNLTKLVSANLQGLAGNDNSLGASLGTNEALVVFESEANDLVAGDTNGSSDVFLRDIVNNQSILVSVSTNGGFGNGESRNAVMTPDGRFVAFVSSANNLVPNDTNRIADVFLRDTQLQTTRQVSVGAGLFTSIPNAFSSLPKISSDGRFVAFLSSATNLLPHVRTVGDLYLRDMESNVTHWVSTNARTILLAHLGSTNGTFYNHAMSTDGRYVAFTGSITSTSSNRAVAFRFDRSTGLTDLVNTTAYGRRFVTPDSVLEYYSSLDISADGRHLVFVALTNGTSPNHTCVLSWDANSGQTRAISITTNGNLAANARYTRPVIDETGQFVAFLSTATDLVTNANLGNFQCYLRDAVNETTTLLSVTTNDAAAGMDSLAAPVYLSTNGRIAAFSLRSGSLIERDWNDAADVFVRNITNQSTELISASQLEPPGRSIGISAPGYSLSANGRYLAFASDASNLVPNDINGVRDVFVRDLWGDTLTLVSVAADGLGSGNGASFEPTISGDGRYVAFTSWASNLVSGDSEQLRDVFVRDLLLGATTNISASLVGTFEYFGPQLDAAGEQLLFRSTSTQSPHLRNLVSGTVRHLNGNSSITSMTPDGRSVIYVMGNRALIHNVASNTIAWATPSLSSAPFTVAISSDGTRAAVGNLNGLTGYTMVNSNAWTILSVGVGLRAGLRFDAAGSFLVFATSNPLVAADTNLRTDAYLADFQTQQSRLISFNPTSGVGNGISDSPDISADGRFIVFRSIASNLVAEDPTPIADIYLYDQNSGQLSCLSRPRTGPGLASNRSHAPRFAADGRSILFQSWAQNLDSRDSNLRGDLFITHLFSATITTATGTPTIRWPIYPGLNYTVEYRNSLLGSPWQLLSAPILVTGQIAETSDPFPDFGQRWYRVVAQEK